MLVDSIEDADSALMLIHRSGLVLEVFPHAQSNLQGTVRVAILPVGHRRRDASSEGLNAHVA